jgi:asparagine synthase (glutamine-hydrolysing)
MCGFAGVLRFDGRAVEPPLLRRMSARLRHRGPDDEGHVLLRPGEAGGHEFRDPVELGAPPAAPLGLAFRRLSIIDVSEAGHQPMTNEDRSLWIVFNGEFYNSEEYAPGLRAAGHRFRSRTDTEVILHLYEEHGLEGTLERMVGMFAFALVDLAAGRLYLVRDRVGVKPLYLHESPQALVFGSEIKALLEVPAVPRALHAEGVAEALARRYVNAPRTIFAGISKLLPGSWREWDLRSGASREVRYWRLFDAVHASATEADYRRELIRSVADRLRSDVPLGVFLSGGLDSSTLCGIVRRDLRLPLQTFSVEFGAKTGVDEGWASQTVAAALGTQHHRIALASDPLGRLPAIVRHCEEPIADPALLATWELCAFTRERVTVALSGEGSDESNYGYRGYTLGLAGRALRCLPRALERPGLSAVAAASGRVDLARLARFADEPCTHASESNFLPELGPCLRAGGQRLPPPPARGGWWRSGWRARSLFDVRPLLDFHTWLLDDLLLKVDKMSMAHSLEVRVPYLDHRLLAVAFALDARRKLAGGVTKAVLRKLARPYLPAEIRRRPQHGFIVPLAPAFERDLFGEGPGRLRDYLLPLEPLLDVETLLRALAPERRLSHAAATRLWLLAMLGLAVAEFRLTIP